MQWFWHKAKFITFSPVPTNVNQSSASTTGSESSPSIRSTLTADSTPKRLLQYPGVLPFRGIKSTLNFGASNTSSFVPIALGQQEVASICAPSVTVDFTAPSNSSGSNHSSRTSSRVNATGFIFLSASSYGAIPSHHSIFSDNVANVTDGNMMKKIIMCTKKN